MRQRLAVILFQCVQGQVEFSTFTRGSPRKPNWRPCVLVQHGTDGGFAQAARFCNARELVERGGYTNIGIQAGTGGCHQVDRDELAVGRVGGFQGGDASPDSIEEGRVGRARGWSRRKPRHYRGKARWPKGAPRNISGRRMAGRSVLSRRFVLSDDQASIGLSRENELGDPGHQQWIEQAGQDRHY